MTFYKDYTFDLIDRMELKYSVYVAALDMQFNFDLPYLWTFAFDMTGEVIYGRNWEDLLQFFKMLHDFGFNYDHTLIIYLNDLTQFFTYSKSFINIDEELLAKSPSEILIFTEQGLEFRDFQAYTEKDIDKLIYTQDMNARSYHVKPADDLVSERVKLTDAEIEYSSRRVLEMTNTIRHDLDLLYQGITKDIKITKTRRIENLLSANLRRCDPDNELFCHIHAMNPLSTDFGMKILLPQLRKAFFGGTVFYENGVLNELYEGVSSADLVSAYCAEFILSKYPISKYKVLPVPEDYHAIFNDYFYSSKALLIQFEARNVKLKKGGLPILPAAMKHYYIDKSSAEERKDAIKRAQRLKLHESKVIRMCLTEIDFELFCRYYTFDEDSFKVLSVLGARYGFLPDYIIKTVAELYTNKMRSKDKKNQLKKLGILDLLQEELYNDDKSAIARLYGIFTQSPVVTKYIFDKEKKDLKLLSSEYLVKDQEFRPVVYQWGVVTTALVRKKLCNLRDKLRDCKIKTLSGDTDCINFIGNAEPIISQFNAKINSQVRARCEAIGIDPEVLKDLGTLEVEKYKYYRLTAVKQYATVRETESGDVFETVCGGMNRECKYFEKYMKKNHYTDAKKAIEHFRLGLTIPAEDEPRKIIRQCSSTKQVDFVDREGNRIRSEVKTYQITQNMKFTLCDPFSDLIEPDQYAAPTTSTPDTVLAALAERVGKIKTSTPPVPKKRSKRK